VQPDLLAAFQRLNFASWLPDDRLFPQGTDDDSATLAAIRHIRDTLPADTRSPSGKLYYQV
jgi:hypothetical protein